MFRALFFLSLLAAMVLGNLAWWRTAHRAAAGLKHRRWLRLGAGLWSGLMLGVLVLLIVSRRANPALMGLVPVWVLALVYLWHFLFVLPWLVWRAMRMVGLLAAFVAKRLRAKPQAQGQAAGDGLLTTRRQFLTTAAIAAPPLVTMAAGWRGVSQLDEFRITRVRLPIAGLPPALDGLSIAHISDIHIGKYTSDALLKNIVDRTNLLRPDLVLMTGDLIDFNLADLPSGLAMMKRLDPRFGLAMCEGNHDLFQGRKEFGRQVTRAGFPLPVNASHSVTVRGQEVQLLGLRWGGPKAFDTSRASSEDLIDQSMRVLMPQVKPGAFPILLAHHPHAFDYMGETHVPLTLAGHTHGGQINPVPWLRPAALRYKYLSGLYEQGGRKLFVSNGIGNWFPLRLNAPAELVHITLVSS